MGRRALDSEEDVRCAEGMSTAQALRPPFILAAHCAARRVGADQPEERRSAGRAKRGQKHRYTCNVCVIWSCSCNLIFLEIQQSFIWPLSVMPSLQVLRI